MKYVPHSEGGKDGTRKADERLGTLGKCVNCDVISSRSLYESRLWTVWTLEVPWNQHII